MSSFKVLIVGGSVAGLTLALILERYNIDYILLEKHETIAPPLGAGIGLWPHGLRIMEQLGLYEKLASMGMPLCKLKTFGPGGRPLSDQNTLGDLTEEGLGYRMLFLDRRELLQTLYDSIGDKSRIHTSSEVCKLDTLDGGVEVKTISGAVYRGDIVVGADGVRSRTREEIWRIADAEDPDYHAGQLRRSITCTYKCLFGISKRPDGIPDDHGFKTFQEGRSYLYQSGAGGKIYWFLFIKNPEVTVHHSIPRYTAEDARDVMEKYAGDILLPGLTLGDLCKLHIRAVLVPVEEFVLDKCFYKRVVLIGDAFHKMNPLTGHGGNTAIESAAMIADLLKEALDSGVPLDDTVIQRLFSRFQSKRIPRTGFFMKAAQMVQHLEALDTPVMKLLNLKVLSKMSPAGILAKTATNVTPGYILRYMPLKRVRGRVPIDSQVQISPKERSASATLCSITSMLIISFVSVVLARCFNPCQMANPGALGSLEAYTSIMAVIINSLWVVESYRWGLLFTPLCSAIPFAFASIIFGRAIITPAYFAIHMYMSRDGSFYYPSPRAINVWIAKSLPIGFVLAYALPFMQAIAWTRYSDDQPVPTATWSTLSMAHLLMPLALRLGQWFYERDRPEIPPVELLYGSQDMAYLTRFYTLLLYLASTAHLVFASYLFSLLKAEGRRLLLGPTVAEAGCLGLAILVWCCFVLWDLRRVNIMNASLPVAILLVILGSVFLGPAATLVAIWRWRECAMEACRQRK